MRRLAVTVGWFALIAATGCQQASDSELQHVFGKTQRTPKTALQACSPAPAGTSLPQGDQYIAAIARQIMSANPETFRGDYAADKFCFRVHNGAMVNAYANPSDRTVTFYTGMLAALGNDAEVAAVMAHELAHVTMQHSGEYESEEVANDPRWQAKGPALKQRLASLAQVQGDLTSRQNVLFEEQDLLERSLEAQMAANVKELRAAVEDEYEALLNEVNAKTMVPRNDYLAFFGLGMLLQAPTPRQSLIEGASEVYEPSTAPDYIALRDKISAYNSRRDAWLAAEKQASDALWAKYDDLKARTRDLSARFDQAYTEHARVSQELLDLRTAIIGAGANNWMEKEADDVGLELYLRAGFAPLHYHDMFNVLEASLKQGAASCAMQNESNAPERGDGSHPSSCWRYYNAKVLEMSEHAGDYTPLLKGATKTEILPGRLDSLKKSFSSESGY